VSYIDAVATLGRSIVETGLDRVAKADVGFGNDNVQGLQSHNRSGRETFVVRATRKICGSAAGAASDGQDEKGCGIHTLTIYAYAGCLNCMLAAASPLSMTKR